MSWFRRKHEHKWDEFAPFKRRCACGREEWLFQSEFPRLGVPGLSWKDMTLYPPPSEEQSKSQFTRGPWMVMPEEAEKLYIRVRGTRLGERFKIANAPFPIVDESEKQEALANAHLIAAAPEMFEALWRVLNHPVCHLDGSTEAAIRAALAKARGEA